MSATIYIEGGGDSNQDLERLFRRSWTTFFKAAGLSGHLPRIVRGGGRDRTFDLFARAIKHPDPKRVPLLLVDSEDPVKAGYSVWQHLQVRDGWDQTPGAGDDQAFMMVQAMETWFLADRDSLKRYFGAEFRENALKQWPKLEDVSKETVLSVLERATANCATPYAKGKVSFELLAQVDPGLVEVACPHAKSLLDRLRTLLR